MKVQKTITTIAFAVAMAVLMQIQSVQAQSQPNTTTNSLANLVANDGTLSIGDKTFSGFSYVNSGLTSFDPANIQVTASIVDGTYYLTWDGNISLAGTTLSTADLLLSYTVTASAGLIYAIDQNYTGGASGGTGSLTVDETAKIASGAVVGFSHLQIGDISDPPAEANDIIDIVPPETTLFVTKDINLAIAPFSGGIGQVSISEVEQSFHQSPVPEPTSIGLLLTGLGTMVYFRRLQKKRS